MKHKLWLPLRNALRIYFEIDGDQRAAAFAFYAFFSLFPMLLFLVSIGSKLIDAHVLTETIFDYVKSVIPLDQQSADEVFGIIVGVVDSRTGIGIVALAGMLWGANHFFHALVRGVNRAWHTLELDWWKVPIKNLAMLGIFASALLFGILVPVVISTLDRFTPLSIDAIPGFANALRYALPSLVLFYGLVMLYKLSPRRKVVFGEVWLAALVVTLALKALQQVLLFYTNNIWHVNAIYGVMGILIVLLLWVYLCGALIIWGACLCAGLHGGDTPGLDSNNAQKNVVHD